VNSIARGKVRERSGSEEKKNYLAEWKKSETPRRERDLGKRLPSSGEKKKALLLSSEKPCCPGRRLGEKICRLLREGGNLLEEVLRRETSIKSWELEKRGKSSSNTKRKPHRPGLAGCDRKEGPDPTRPKKKRLLCESLALREREGVFPVGGNLASWGPASPFKGTAKGERTEDLRRTRLNLGKG